jgi:hypothetical protein
MKTLYTFLAFLLLSFTASATAYVTTASGNFSAGATWVGGVAPSLGGDTWSNAPGLTLTYDVDNHLTSGWGACTNSGFLVMTNLPCYLLMNGNLAGKGTNLIGSATTPVPFTSSNTPMCYIQFTNGTAQLTMIGTNSMPMYGTPHLTNMYLSSFAELGATSITVSNVPSWLNTNDVLWIAPTNTTQGQGGEYYMVGSISGHTISFLQTLTGNTNFLPGNVLVTSIPTTHRQVGCQIAVLSCSVVFLEMQPRTISTITAILTNTIIGVTLQNLGLGLAYSGCSGWTASYNTANNCNNGGLAYTDCCGWTASYNTNINSGALFISCWSIIATQSPSTNDTIGGTASFYSTIQFDNTIWIDPAGSVTNNNGTYVHSCSSGNSNNPVPLTIQFSVRPGAYRNILIATQATNNVQYYAAVSQGMTPPLPLSLVNSGNNLGNWTNTVLTYTNNSAFPIIANVWVASQGGVSSNGYSTVQLGQDVVVNKY